MFRALIDQLIDHLKWLDQQIQAIETQIKTWHKNMLIASVWQKYPALA